MYSDQEKKSFLPIFHPDYLPPEPELIKRVIQSMGLNQSQVAMITGVAYSLDKGSVSVRRWATERESKHNRDIESARWRLIVEAAGLSTTADTIALLKG